MANVFGIKNVKALLDKLEDRRRKSLTGDNGSVVVGYNAKYAVWVHEMIEKHAGEPRTGTRKDGSKRTGRWWDPIGRGQPKYLEQPARELSNSGELARVIRESYKGGAGARNSKGQFIGAATLLTALAVGAQRIQRESQKLVPVDLGNLKGSAFVEKEL